jgi:chromosome segregation ATPase
VRRLLETARAELRARSQEQEGMIASYKKQQDDNLAIIARLERRLERSPSKSDMTSSFDSTNKVIELEALVGELRSQLAKRKKSDSSSSSSSDEDKQDKAELAQRLKEREAELADLKRQWMSQQSSWEIERTSLLTQHNLHQSPSDPTPKGIVADLKEDRTRLESDNLRLQGEVAALMASNQAVLEEKAALKTDNAALQAKVSDLEDSFSEVKAQSAAMSGGDSVAQVSAALASEDRLKRRVKALEDEKGSLDFVFTAQQTKLDESSKKLLEAEQQLREERQRYQSLSVELKELKAQQQADMRATEAAKALEITALSGKVARLEQEARVKYSELTVEVETTTKTSQKKSKLKERELLLQGQIEDLRRQAVASQLKEESLQSQLAEKTELLQAAYSRLGKSEADDEDKKKLTLKQEEIGRLNLELDSARGREAEAQQAISLLQMQLKESELKLMNMEGEWTHREQSQRSLVEDLRSRNVHLQSLLEVTHKPHKESADSDSSSTDSEVEDLRTELQGEKIKVQELKAELLSLRAQGRKPSIVMAKTSSSTLGEWEGKKKGDKEVQPRCRECLVF